MEEIRWGMIGYGDVTERKSGPAFNRVEHSRLVAVAGRTPGKARDYAQRHGIPTWHENAQALIADPQVNAVYIATPPDSHAEYTIQAARAGKAVYVEKPMARAYAECQQMQAACAQAGVPLFVAYYRRCLPMFLKVKETIENGIIGEVRAVQIRFIRPPQPADLDPNHLPWRVQPGISGGGYFYDLASHQLDYLDYLFGPVANTASQVANRAGLYPAEDTLAAAWTHASGVVGSGLWCFTAGGQATDQAEIIGSRGRVTFSYFDQAPLCVFVDGKEEEQFLYPRQDPIQLPLIQRIVAALRGEGDCPSTGESAARTNWVMEQMAGSSAA